MSYLLSNVEKILRKFQFYFWDNLIRKAQAKGGVLIEKTFICPHVSRSFQLSLFDSLSIKTVDLPAMSEEESLSR